MNNSISCLTFYQLAKTYLKVLIHLLYLQCFVLDKNALHRINDNKVILPLLLES